MTFSTNFSLRLFFFVFSQLVNSVLLRIGILEIFKVLKDHKIYNNYSVTPLILLYEIFLQSAHVKLTKVANQTSFAVATRYIRSTQSEHSVLCSLTELTKSSKAVKTCTEAFALPQRKTIILC